MNTVVVIKMHGTEVQIEKGFSADLENGEHPLRRLLLRITQFYESRNVPSHYRLVKCFDGDQIHMWHNGAWIYPGWLAGDGSEPPFWVEV